MRTVTVDRVYLEMRAPPPPDPRAAMPSGLAVRLEREHPCSVPLFRRLYREVGEAHHWHDRDPWPDDRLARHLARADVEIWILRVNDEAAGFFELARHVEDASTEIAYLGLVPRFLGRGLGRLLLARAIELAWRGGSRRVWLHTCSLDAPAALPNYVARGFREYRRETYEAEIPD